MTPFGEGEGQEIRQKQGLPPPLRVSPPDPLFPSPYPLALLFCGFESAGLFAYWKAAFVVFFRRLLALDLLLFFTTEKERTWTTLLNPVLITREEQQSMPLMPNPRTPQIQSRRKADKGGGERGKGGLGEKPVGAGGTSAFVGFVFSPRPEGCHPPVRENIVYLICSYAPKWVHSESR